MCSACMATLLTQSPTEGPSSHPMYGKPFAESLVLTAISGIIHSSAPGHSTMCDLYQSNVLKHPASRGWILSPSSMLLQVCHLLRAHLVINPPCSLLRGLMLPFLLWRIISTSAGRLAWFLSQHNHSSTPDPGLTPSQKVWHSCKDLLLKVESKTLSPVYLSLWNWKHQHHLWNPSFCYLSKSRCLDSCSAQQPSGFCSGPCWNLLNTPAKYSLVFPLGSAPDHIPFLLGCNKLP